MLDSSVALAWCFEDEQTESTAELFERLGRESAAVPSLWFIELTNVLALSERKRRATQAKTAEFIALVQKFDLEVDQDGPGRAFNHVLDLCREHRLTAYDAMYLDLAIRKRLPLATLDDELRKAAKRANIPLLGR